MTEQDRIDADRAVPGRRVYAHAPIAPAKRCSTCDGVLTFTDRRYSPLDASAPTVTLPIDCDGRCPRCMFSDSRVCACGVRRTAAERAEGACECGDAAGREAA